MARGHRRFPMRLPALSLRPDSLATVGDFQARAQALTRDPLPRPVGARWPASLKDALYRGRATAALAGSITLGAAAVAGYIGFVLRYSSNAVWMDEWNWVELMSKSYAGSLTLGDLWIAHNENRMLFPNLILLGLGRLTGFSILAFIYLGAALLIAAVVLLVIACRADVVRHPLLYVPATLIFFSTAQYENSLWGIQFSIFLVVACITGTLTLLSAPHISRWRFGGAAVIGIVASFSFIQGLTVWP